MELPRAEVSVHECAEKTVTCPNAVCLEIHRSECAGMVSNKAFDRWVRVLATPPQTGRPSHYHAAVGGAYADATWHLPLPVRDPFKLMVGAADSIGRCVPSNGGVQLVTLPAVVKEARVLLTRDEPGGPVRVAAHTACERVLVDGVAVTSEASLLKAGCKLTIEGVCMVFCVSDSVAMDDGLVVGRMGTRVDQEGVRRMAALGLVLLKEFGANGHRHQGELHTALLQRAHAPPAPATGTREHGKQYPKHYEGVHRVVRFLRAAGALPASHAPVNEDAQDDAHVRHWCALLCMAAARTHYGLLGGMLGVGACWSVPWLASDYLGQSQGFRRDFFQLFQDHLAVVARCVAELERGCHVGFSLTGASSCKELPNGHRIELKRDPEGDFRDVLTLSREAMGSVENAGGVWLLRATQGKDQNKHLRQLRLNRTSLFKSKAISANQPYVLHSGDCIQVGSKHGAHYDLMFVRPNDAWHNAPDTSAKGDLLRRLLIEGEALKEHRGEAAQVLDAKETTLADAERAALSELAYALMLSPTNWRGMYGTWRDDRGRDGQPPARIQHGHGARAQSQALRHCLWAAKNEESHQGTANDLWTATMVTGLMWAALGMWEFLERT